MEFYTGSRRAVKRKKKQGRKAGLVLVSVVVVISTFGYLRLVCVDETGSVLLLLLYACGVVIG